MGGIPGLASAGALSSLAAPVRRAVASAAPSFSTSPWHQREGRGHAWALRDLGVGWAAWLGGGGVN
eukprot:8413918-Alexandrium_andersonii.AAC.1